MHYRVGASVGFYLFMHRYIYLDLNTLTLTTVKLFLCKVKGNKYPTLQERKKTKLKTNKTPVIKNEYAERYQYVTNIQT